MPCVTRNGIVACRWPAGIVACRWPAGIVACRWRAGIVACRRYEQGIRKGSATDALPSVGHCRGYRAQAMAVSRMAVSHSALPASRDKIISARPNDACGTMHQGGTIRDKAASRAASVQVLPQLSEELYHDMLPAVRRNW